MADPVERLKIIVAELQGLPHVTETCREAADLIEALTAQVAVMGEALEPFAKAAGKLDGLWDESDWRWNDSVLSNVTVRDIRLAAKARLAAAKEPKT